MMRAPVMVLSKYLYSRNLFYSFIFWALPVKVRYRGVDDSGFPWQIDFFWIFGFPIQNHLKCLEFRGWINFWGQISGISDTNLKIETIFMEFLRDSGKNWTGISVAQPNFDWISKHLFFLKIHVVHSPILDFFWKSPFTVAWVCLRKGGFLAFSPVLSNGIF